MERETEILRSRKTTQGGRGGWGGEDRREDRQLKALTLVSLLLLKLIVTQHRDEIQLNSTSFPSCPQHFLSPLL